MAHTPAVKLMVSSDITDCCQIALLMDNMKRPQHIEIAISGSYTYNAMGGHGNIVVQQIAMPFCYDYTKAWA